MIVERDDYTSKDVFYASLELRLTKEPRLGTAYLYRLQMKDVSMATVTQAAETSMLSYMQGAIPNLLAGHRKANDDAIQLCKEQGDVIGSHVGAPCPSCPGVGLEARKTPIDHASSSPRSKFSKGPRNTTMLYRFGHGPLTKPRKPFAARFQYAQYLVQDVRCPALCEPVSLRAWGRTQKWPRISSGMRFFSCSPPRQRLPEPIYPQHHGLHLPRPAFVSRDAPCQTSSRSSPTGRPGGLCNAP